MTPPQKYTFLQANIGRGHPFYLDGIIEQLRRRPESIDLEELDAESLSRGVSKAAWVGVRRLYEQGSSGGPLGALYARLRRGGDYSKQRLALALLGRDLRRRFLRSSETLVVSHPVLVAILAGRPNLIYQHGELVAPEESRVLGASVVLVPTEQVAALFRDAGYSAEQIKVTGLCIEPVLADSAESSYRLRLGRMADQGPLTGLFFSSGAAPRHHIKTIISSIASCNQAGLSARVLARRSGRLDRAVRVLCGAQGIKLHCDSADPGRCGGAAQCCLVNYDTRRDEAATGAALAARADFIVGPPHERTNWAVGLGLPMFAVTPCIGPFAPLNLRLLETSGTGVAIKSPREASALGETVMQLRVSGQLARMAECGWGNHRIDGFEQIARFLTDTG